MIGLGVGIDYALFILTRFREAYVTPGRRSANARESVVQAIDTAGRAVLFAGCTVVIALLGMMLLGVDFLYGVAISASIGVLLVMLASLTLLPALLTLVGARLARPGRRARRRARKAPDAGAEAAAARRRGPGRRRRRRLAALEHVRRAPAAHDRGVSALVMLLIAAPATALRLGSSDASNDPSGQTTHRAYELLAQGFGQGFNGPLLVAARIPNGAARPERPVRLRSASLARTGDVASVAPAKSQPGGRRRRRSPSIRAPPRRPTPPPSSSNACARRSSRRSPRRPA